MLALIFSGSVRTSNPATVPVPPVGDRIPVSMRIVVDLPAPFGPRKPKISPFCTSKLTRFTAVKLPKRFSRFFTTTAVSWLLAFMVSVLPFGGQDRYEDVFQRRLDRADATDGKARADEHSFRLHRSLIRVLCHQVNAVAEQACGIGRASCRGRGE